MVDFHTHTIFSDGALTPAEHVRRAYMNGYTAIGITDHVDFSNIEFVFSSIKEFADSMKASSWDIRIIPGVEITHVPADMIENITSKAKRMNIPLIIFHGESPVEPVEKGANRAAILAGVDILAHPGLITEDDVKLAVKHDVALEITSKKGHSLTNGHVAKLALKHGARLVLDTDTHAPEDFFTPEHRERVIRGAGLTDKEILKVESDIEYVLDKVLKRAGGS